MSIPRKLSISYILPAFILLGMSGIAWWLFHNPVSGFSESLPGMDNRKKGKAVTTETIKIGEFFLAGKSIPEVPGTRWTHFRGADFDNINKENIPLLEKFGKTGPRILWKIPLGEGHAAPAVYDGMIYLLDYDENTKSDALRCLSLQSGEELWRRSYKVHLKRNHGLSRTIPAVNDKYVLSLGPRCQVMCVERLSGRLLWGLDVAREFNTEVPFWYTGQCPFIDNDTAVIATGGKSLMIGIDCKSGKLAWQTPNPRNWKMSHSSVMPMVLNGKKMYVYCAIGGLCGISASGTDKGKLLWELSEFSPSVVAPSPLILDKGKILMTAGYGAGSALIQVTEAAGSFSAKVLQKFKPLEGLASEQQTPVFSKGYIYAILPKDAGDMRNQFVCCKAGDCRKYTMSSGKTLRFGLGPYLMADGKFFILNDDGELTIAKATPTDFKVLDKARIIDGQDSWGPLAITGGYLLMRDSKQMVCIDIKAR